MQRLTEKGARSETTIIFWGVSSVGLEHLVYTQGVTGSNPVLPTTKRINLLNIRLILFLCPEIIPTIIIYRFIRDLMFLGLTRLIVHCRTQQEATRLLTVIKRQLTDCGLTAHPEKTKVVHCKKSGRNLKGFPVQFDFLDFSFRPIRMKLKRGGRHLPLLTVGPNR